MKFYGPFILLLIALLGAGCGAPAATQNPLQARLTRTPAPKNARLPTATNSVQAISPSNASKVLELARLSRGIVQQTVWLPDGKRLMVATTVGVYLYNFPGGDEVKLFDTGVPTIIAVSPDGHLLATGEGPIVRLWEIETGKELYTLGAGDKKIERIIFSPDQHTLAVERVFQNAAGEGAVLGIKAVQAWNLSTKELIYTLIGRSLPAFRPDGRVLAVAYNKQIEFWDASANLLLDSATGDQNFAYNPIGDSFAIFALDQGSWNSKTVQFKNLDTWQTLCQFSNVDLFSNLAFSPDGSKLATSNEHETAQVWDTKTCRPLYKVSGHKGFVDILFDPQGKVLASYGRLDQTMKLWDTQSGRLLRTLDGFRGDLGDFSPDGQFLIEKQWFDGTISVWNVSTGKLVLSLDKHTPHASSIAFSPDGKLVAAGFSYGEIYLWSVATGQAQNILHGNNSYIKDIAFDPGGQFIASCDTDAQIELWDVNSGQHLRTFQGHKKNTWVTKIAFSSDGKTLASAGTDNSIRVWDMATGQTRYVFVLADNQASNGEMAFSPDGHTISIVTSKKFISLYSVSDGEFLTTFSTPTDSDYINHIVFSKDGQALLASGYQSIWVWDFASKKLTATLENAGNNIQSIALSPDGKVLALSSWTGKNNIYEIKLWDVGTRSLLSGLAKDTDWIPKLAFSADGQLLGSASADGTVRLWGLQP